MFKCRALNKRRRSQACTQPDFATMRTLEMEIFYPYSSITEHLQNSPSLFLTRTYNMNVYVSTYVDMYVLT